MRQMATLYRIRDWNDNFETHETRKLKSLDWTRLPNKQDGLGFRRIAAHPRRVELFCAWTLIVQVASKSPRDQRGQLIRDNLPLSPGDLSVITGFPEEIFEVAFSFFSEPNVGWLVASELFNTNSEIPKSPGNLPLSPGIHPDEREERRGEEIRNTPPTPRARVLPIEHACDAAIAEQVAAVVGSSRLPPDWEPTAAHRREAVEHGLDFDGEVAAFKLRRRSSGYVSFDWDADFSGWLLKSKGLKATERGTAPSRASPSGFAGRKTLDQINAEANEKLRLERERDAQRKGAVA